VVDASCLVNDSASARFLRTWPSPMVSCE
jgi:hypothetical protein